MFDLDRFIEDCRQARAEDDDYVALRKVPGDMDETLRLFEDSNLLFDRVQP